MTALEALVDQPVLRGRTVRLEPLGHDVLEDYLRGLQDPEVRRLTGTHAVHDRAAVEQWLRSRAAQHDRADWAVVREGDGQFLGEAVLHELDVNNASAGYRVWLSGPGAVGHGHGTEVTQLVVAFALDVLGLHRLLWMSSSTTGGPGARTRGAASSSRGGCATPCCGRAGATTPWPCRCCGRTPGPAAPRARVGAQPREARMDHDGPLVTDLAALLTAQDAATYREFLRVPALSLGLFAVGQGHVDTQTPHRQDEVYVVLDGAAVLEVAGERTPVSAGSVAYVPALVPHRFVDVTVDLRVVVVFAPALTESPERQP